ncbi:N-acetylmuramoyl-L-alanine amidase [Paenibacillus sp. 1011MAR3C5]|uniref:N-acetylmuramoyl-L-alanine amidase family protein n=1 Tax=Paenibacillus sp. 1011MAR3C5 TaxID=1675787 RepID=UPI000E6B75DD|nr:N-acetylmuramoyl-L-alanine amidase [Paenibacillus sp. 1011MAR3C5]RJE90828.1 N-acetylmuramoyl-L-alanine amidase [Paenibacillus sp. 1011MAR3C5]
MHRLLIISLLSLICAVGGNASAGASGEERLERYDKELSWTLPHTTVIIDVGHGGIDGGASHGSTLEKDINLAVASKLYLILRSQGIPAVMNRTGDYALSEENRWHNTRSRHRKDLSQRRQLTEEIGNELLVSLHVNAARNSTKRGPLVLHQTAGESALLAFCLQDALNRQQATVSLPRLGEPFYLLRRVDQPSVIIEMGFISNAADRAMLTDPAKQNEIAHAIASGIRQYKWVAH